MGMRAFFPFVERSIPRQPRARPLMLSSKHISGLIRCSSSCFATELTLSWSQPKEACADGNV